MIIFVPSFPESRFNVTHFSITILLRFWSAGLAYHYAAFLSWLRLATYMAIVSVAIVISFHLKRQPTATELRLALPFGLLFWLLSLACLASGVSNYIRTVQRYSRRAALVQSGWKTQVVGFDSLLHAKHRYKNCFADHVHIV